MVNQIKNRPRWKPSDKSSITGERRLLRFLRHGITSEHPGFGEVRFRCMREDDKELEAKVSAERAKAHYLRHRIQINC